MYCHCANGNNTSFYPKIFQYNLVQGETSVKTNSDDWSYASDCTFQIPHLFHISGLENPPVIPTYITGTAIA
jgi:hypothetical protein